MFVVVTFVQMRTPANLKMCADFPWTLSHNCVFRCGRFVFANLGYVAVFFCFTKTDVLQ